MRALAAAPPAATPLVIRALEALAAAEVLSPALPVAAEFLAAALYLDGSRQTVLQHKDGSGAAAATAAAAGAAAAHDGTAGPTPASSFPFSAPPTG